MKSEKIYTEYLLINAQAGDSKAADDLVRVLQPRIKAFVLKVMGGSAAVDDCVQEALLKVFQQMKQIKQVKAMHTWVFRVVHSCCMDYVRKTHGIDSAQIDSSDDIPSKDQKLDQKLDMNAAIRSLSSAQQSVIFLFYFEGFKVAEVAEILAKPAGTIKSMLFEARSHIKDKLS